MSKFIIGAVIVLVGIVINFALLYVMLFQVKNEVGLYRQAMEDNVSRTVVPLGVPTSTQIIPATSSGEVCLKCREDIDEIKKVIVKLTPASPSFTSIPQTSESQVKEVFIPLGAGGKVQTNDWQDVSGMSATIDSANYSKIKSVTFEISMRIPTANGIVYARLFNKTDKHPVWYSEVSSEGPLSTTKQASNISLDTGNKAYQVQMKNTLKYESIADSAQLKIILQ
jgi:hypothetical protein